MGPLQDRCAYHAFQPWQCSWFGPNAPILPVCDTKTVWQECNHYKAYRWLQELLVPFSICVCCASRLASSNLCNCACVQRNIKGIAHKRSRVWLFRLRLQHRHTFCQQHHCRHQRLLPVPATSKKQETSRHCGVWTVCGQRTDMWSWRLPEGCTRHHTSQSFALRYTCACGKTPTHLAC